MRNQHRVLVDSSKRRGRELAVGPTPSEPVRPPAAPIWDGHSAGEIRSRTVPSPSLQSSWRLAAPPPRLGRSRGSKATQTECAIRLLILRLYPQSMRIDVRFSESPTQLARQWEVGAGGSALWFNSAVLNLAPPPPPAPSFAPTLQIIPVFYRDSRITDQTGVGVRKIMSPPAPLG